jgi:hypothetical protein
MPAIDVPDGEVAETDMPVIAPAEHGCPGPDVPAESDPGGLLVLLMVARFMRFSLSVGLMAQGKHKNRRNRNRKARRHPGFLRVWDERTNGPFTHSDPREPAEIGSTTINLLRRIDVAVEVFLLSI